MIPFELIESVQNNEAILLIGSGLSREACLPGWSKLIQPLSQSVGAHWPSNESDLSVSHILATAQHYENKHGRNTLIRHLRKMLDTSRTKPALIHELIVSLPINIFFTTNYDDMIEQTFRQSEKRCNVIINETDLAFWREDEVNLVKLFGDLYRPDSLIITKRDFNTYFASRPRITERLRGFLESKTPIFLGYSLHDPFFDQIWDRIGFDFGSLRRIGYAVLFDAHQLTVDDLYNRGIHVINLETKNKKPTAALEAWLQELCKKINLSSNMKTIQPSNNNCKTNTKYDIGILTVIGPELKAVQKTLEIDDIRNRIRCEGDLYWRATLFSEIMQRKLNIVLHCLSSAGEASASSGITKIIDRFKPQFVILVGIAAGRRKKIRIGDVAVPRAVVDHSSTVAKESGNKLRAVIPELPHPVAQMFRAFNLDTEQWHTFFDRLFEEEIEIPNGAEDEYKNHVTTRPRLEDCAIASADILLKNPNILENLSDNVHQDIKIGEMEAAGFIKACHGRSPHFVIFITF